MERDLAAFRIGELSQRTGVGVATLRAWESRYRLLHPSRTAGGQRLYSAEDETRIEEVKRLVASGTALGAAARWVADNPGPSGTATTTPAEGHRQGAGGRRGGLALATRLRRSESSESSEQSAPAGGEVLVDVHETTRAMVHAATPADVVAVLAGFVRHVGGALVDAQIDDAVLPVDLSFGVGPPMLPWAEPMSVARMTLEQALPSLVEDARRLIDLLRRARTEGFSP